MPSRQRTPSTLRGPRTRRIRLPCRRRARPRWAPPLSRRPRPLFPVCWRCSVCSAPVGRGAGGAPWGALACWHCSVCSARYCTVPSRPLRRTAPRPSPQSRGRRCPKAAVPSALPLPRADPLLGAARWAALGPRLGSSACSSSPWWWASPARRHHRHPSHPHRHHPSTTRPARRRASTPWMVGATMAEPEPYIRIAASAPTAPTAALKCRRRLPRHLCPRPRHHRLLRHHLRPRHSRRHHHHPRRPRARQRSPPDRLSLAGVLRHGT